MTTTIEWTDETWNPTVGCSRVSDGCRGCYAMHQAHRGLDAAHRGLTVVSEEFGVDWNGDVRQLPDRLAVPLRWRKPRRVFVDSMSDLFHPQAEYGFIVRVFAVMAAAAQHTFQVLTKRPKIMAGIVDDRFGRSFEEAVHEQFEEITGPGALWPGWPLPNVWLGTSIESDQYTFRADHVRATPAVVRFLSLEPLLGPLPSLNLDDIGWVIVGGESGTRARPMHPQWARDIRDRCVTAGIPFLFKQWGDFGPAGSWRGPDHHVTIDGRLFRPGQRLGMNHMCQPAAIHRWGKKKAGRELDRRTWDEYPAVAA